MKILLFIISSLLINCSENKTNPVNDTIVFKSGMEGYQTFRIPAIIKAPNGDLLAFCEGRVNSESDAGDIDMVLKRSSNNGKTWSKLNVIWDDGENTCGNPAPVVDLETGIIYLLMTWNLGSDHEGDIIKGTSKDSRRVFVISSSDNGYSWTRPKEITKEVKKNNWTWYATGPVHGIQKGRNPNKGRLIIPCDHIVSGNKQYYSHIIYSDDHGVSWHLGGSTPQHQVNECTVAELPNGELLLNMRNYDRAFNFRKISQSADGGITWGDIYPDTALIEPICQASMIEYNFNDKNLFFFTNPASKDSRKNMTVKASMDNGKTWANSKIIYSGSSAYSDIVILNNGRIGVLYEKDDYQKISFSSICLENIIN